MITKVNGNNYEELFRAAERQLVLPEGSIDSIHKYLDVISDIKVRSDSNNYNLLRLPVEADEPLFEIDANTREITVPGVFKTNGLTVEGDVLAEIVYFKMARFFDMMDLYRFANQGVQTTNVHEGPHTYIEWQNLSSKDPDHQRGVDFAYAMTCDDNYIYFGWPLADKVSGDSGNIQFAVRFLEIEDGQIKYNYSTKIASCEIKTTLNFDFSDGSIRADSWEELLYNRPIYSSVINSTESPAPILLKGIDSGVYDMTERDVQEQTGTDPESGDPVYTTKKVWNLDIPVVATVSTAVGKDKEGNPLSQTLYFKWYRNNAILPESEKPKYVTTTEPGAAGNDDEGNPYDSNAVKSTFHADSVGRYTVWIGNQIADKKNVRYIYTGTVTIPEPEDVLIDNSGIVEKGYVGSTILTAGIANTVSAQNLVYTWYKEGQEETPVQEGPSASYTPVDEGVYWVTVQNKRNNEITEITDGSTSVEADIRMRPQKLQSLVLTYSNDGKFFRVDATHQYTKHKIHYQWYRVDPQTGDTVKVYDVETGSMCEFEPTDPGNYFVTGREVVFDEETGALRQEANISDRVTSNEISLNANLQAAEG